MNAEALANANRTDDATLRRAVIGVLRQLGIAGRFIDVNVPNPDDGVGHVALQYEPPARAERELELVGLLARLPGVVAPWVNGRVIILRFRR